MRRELPANFGAIAANGLFFPTAGEIVATGLLLTWFVSELTSLAVCPAVTRRVLAMIRQQGENKPDPFRI